MTDNDNRLGIVVDLVIPAEVSIPRAHESFGSNGDVLDKKLEQELQKLGTELVRYAGLMGR